MLCLAAAWICATLKADKAPAVLIPTIAFDCFYIGAIDMQAGRGYIAQTLDLMKCIASWRCNADFARAVADSFRFNGSAGKVVGYGVAPLKLFAFQAHKHAPTAVVMNGGNLPWREDIHYN
jgi:hypothetical protein